MHWFEDEVRALERRLATLGQTGHTVFFGSSSIRLWPDLEASFPDMPVINAGFGGSTLVACAWFFNRIVVPLKPSRLVLYAGDNDIADGSNLDDFARRLGDLLDTIDHFLPGLPLYMGTIKSSPARRHLEQRILSGGDLIFGRMHRRPGSACIDLRTPLLAADGRPDPACFANDGLHLSPAGYARWTPVLRAALE